MQTVFTHGRRRCSCRTRCRPACSAVGTRRAAGESGNSGVPPACRTRWWRSDCTRGRAPESAAAHSPPLAEGGRVHRDADRWQQRRAPTLCCAAWLASSLVYRSQMALVIAPEGMLYRTASAHLFSLALLVDGASSKRLMACCAAKSKPLLGKAHTGIIILKTLFSYSISVEQCARTVHRRTISTIRTSCHLSTLPTHPGSVAARRSSRRWPGRCARPLRSAGVRGRSCRWPCRPPADRRWRQTASPPAAPESRSPPLGRRRRVGMEVRACVGGNR